MKAIPFVCILALLAACGGSSDPVGPDPVTEAEIVMVDEARCGPAEDDAAEIASAGIEGDSLRLLVAYGGGCKTHRFALYGGNAFMESNPPQAALRLCHDADGDACEAWIRQELLFDLGPLKRRYQELYGETGILLLQIRGPGQAGPAVPLVTYSF